jgi:E3 ubiquitin-protein ligase BAH
MSAVVGCFNEKAKKLLELHLASGFKKYAMWFTNRCHKNHGQLIQQGKDLVTYAIINAVAMRKILKKYDKVWQY